MRLPIPNLKTLVLVGLSSGLAHAGELSIGDVSIGGGQESSSAQSSTSGAVGAVEGLTGLVTSTVSLNLGVPGTSQTVSARACAGLGVNDAIAAGCGEEDMSRSARRVLRKAERDGFVYVPRIGSGMPKIPSEMLGAGTPEAAVLGLPVYGQDNALVGRISGADILAAEYLESVEILSLQGNRITIVNGSDSVAPEGVWLALQSTEFSLFDNRRKRKIVVK